MQFPGQARAINSIFCPALQLISAVWPACVVSGRIFKTTGRSVQEDVNLLHASVLSMVEFDDDIFAAGNCFDWNEHPAQPGLSALKRSYQVESN